MDGANFVKKCFLLRSALSGFFQTLDQDGGPFIFDLGLGDFFPLSSGLINKEFSALFHLKERQISPFQSIKEMSGRGKEKTRLKTLQRIYCNYEKRTEKSFRRY